jgi:replicative DNA helicase
MNTDRLHDEFSEKEIIGGLLSNHESFPNVFDILQPNHFYKPEFEAIYRAFVETYKQEAPADLQTLANKSGVNAAFLVSTMGEIYLGAQRRTAERIASLSQKRSIARKLAEIGSMLADSTVEELTGRLTEIAVGISLESGQKRVLEADKLVERVREVQESRKKEPGMIRGIRTGYPALDLTLRGLRPRRMTLLVAATGFGKSTMAVNVFSNSVQSGVKTLLISTENDVDDNLDRIAGIVTGLELKDVESGHKAEHVSECFARRFKGTSCFISDNSPRNIHEIIGTIARYVLKHGVELVFVDYIGEIALDGVKNENEEARLTRYSQALLEASKTLNCHIVVLAQLNRDGNRKGRPGKTELQGCFKMAQKAHSMLIFWQTDEGQDVISVDKNRQGPAKIDIAMKFQRTTQRITEQGFYSETSKSITPLGSRVSAENAEFVDLD